MKFIVEKILAWLAAATLRKYQPIIIGITGSVGKTSTKEAIFVMLKNRYRVRRSEKSYNTEIGVPLTILGAENPHRNVFGWLGVFLRSVSDLIVGGSYPHVLILELGVQKPGDMAYLLHIASPFIGVVTAIGEIPVHVEFFAGPPEVAREKSELIRLLPSHGYAVLNADDGAVRDMKSVTRASIFYFGFTDDASVRIQDYRLHGETGWGARKIGISFVVHHAGFSAPLYFPNVLGKPSAYAAAAAASVGLIMKMSLNEITAALANYAPPPGRLKILRGNKEAVILDDTYNASPASMSAALEVLREFSATRKIAVIGDMLELGTLTEAAHRTVGAEVAKTTDLFFAVGERMKFAVDAVNSRWPDNAGRIFWFAQSRDVGETLEKEIRSGDVILIKGSQGMRMEKVVKEIMAEPQRARELLVRQDQEWLTRR